MTNLITLQLFCILLMTQAPQWSVFNQLGLVVNHNHSKEQQSSSPILLVQANPLSHVIPRVRTIITRLKNSQTVGQWFGRLRSISPTNNPLRDHPGELDPLASTVQYLQQELHLKGDEVVILRHQLSRMKAMIQLEKREKSQAKQQLRDLLAAVDAQHKEQTEQLEKEYNKRMLLEKESLIDILKRQQAEEKNTMMKELQESFASERERLVQELTEAKQSCSQAMVTVAELKNLILQEEQKRAATLAEYEKREGMYLKTIEELKEVIRRQEQKPQETLSKSPVNISTNNKGFRGATTASSAQPSPDERKPQRSIATPSATKPTSAKPISSTNSTISSQTKPPYNSAASNNNSNVMSRRLPRRPPQIPSKSLTSNNSKRSQNHTAK